MNLVAGGGGPEGEEQEEDKGYLWVPRIGAGSTRGGGSTGWGFWVAERQLGLWKFMVKSKRAMRGRRGLATVTSSSTGVNGEETWVARACRGKAP